MSICGLRHLKRPSYDTENYLIDQLTDVIAIVIKMPLDPIKGR